MNYHELQVKGRELTRDQVNRQLRELARDPRFAAVPAWLERNEDAWKLDVSSQTMANNPGKLAHAAGSLHAVLVLISQLAALVDKPAKRESAMSNEQ